MKILVIGGGISGMTAAIEASEAGCEVLLVERNAFLGGRVAQMHQYFPKLCPPLCGLEINLRRIRTSDRIICSTFSEVVEITGETGRFLATIRHRPRFVDESCTNCGACVRACPVYRPDTFNLGMSSTRAVYLPHTMAFPQRHAIDAAFCEGVSCSKCVPSCPQGAIHLDQDSTIDKVEVGAVIWATGWDPPDASAFEGLGYGTHPNIVTNLAMERLASPSGPTMGRIVRPSDGAEPTSVAFVQCAGSRDEKHLLHCSAACCMASLKQARYVRAQLPDANVTIFYIDLRAPGRQELFLAESRRDTRLELVKGKVARVTALGTSGDLGVEAEDTLAGERFFRRFSLVVLATGMVPALGASDSPSVGALRRDAHGFIDRTQAEPGWLSAGCAREPADVATCVREATGAAMRAIVACARPSHG
jgi:quinone-modifying oxidoreductase, subunit QmoA